MDHQLADKVAIVTGGASGIGLATATALAASGARVAIADLDEVGAKQAAADVAASTGAATLALTVDVTDASAAASMVHATEEHFGAVHVLCHNAGLAGYPRPADIADVAVFLSSDLARFVTGVVLPVDGGRSI